MTPAVNSARKAKIPFQLHEYSHDPANASYGTEAAEKLGVSDKQVFKTLVVSLDSGALAVGVIPVAAKLSMKHIARAAGARKAAMAAVADVERATGYVLGGVSPLGQKKRLPTFIDASARDFPSIYVSAGRRGLEIELAATDLCQLTQGVFTELCQQDLATE